MSGCEWSKAESVERPRIASGSMTQVLHILPHPGGGGERLVDVLEHLGGGYEHRRVYLTHSRRPISALASIVGGRRQLARQVEQADLLHVMGDASACLTVRLLGRRPAVLGTHGLHLLRRSGGLSGRLVRAALRRAVGAASVTVCSSAPELDELRALCSPQAAAKLRLVTNGIELPEAVAPEERRRARHELGIPEAAFVVLYAGQLEDRKRPLDAVRRRPRARARRRPPRGRRRSAAGRARAARWP